jgi:hypothetical protein
MVRFETGWSQGPRRMREPDRSRGELRLDLRPNARGTLEEASECDRRLRGPLMEWAVCSAATTLEQMVNMGLLDDGPQHRSCRLSLTEPEPRFPAASSVRRSSSLLAQCRGSDNVVLRPSEVRRPRR